MIVFLFIMVITLALAVCGLFLWGRKLSSSVLEFGKATLLNQQRCDSFDKKMEERLTDNRKHLFISVSSPIASLVKRIDKTDQAVRAIEKAMAHDKKARYRADAEIAALNFSDYKNDSVKIEVAPAQWFTYIERRPEPGVKVKVKLKAGQTPPFSAVLVSDGEYGTCWKYGHGEGEGYVTVGLQDMWMYENDQAPPSLPPASGDVRLKKGDFICMTGKDKRFEYWKCIVADSDSAVFGKVLYHRVAAPGKCSVSWADIFITHSACSLIGHRVDSLPDIG